MTTRLEIPTFIFAGHETTSAASAWALHALSFNIDAQTKLREKLFTLSSENPTMEQLNSLSYLDSVVKETLRVHAPVPAVGRMATQDDVLPLATPYIDSKAHNTLIIPKGQIIHIPISTVNTGTEVWGPDAAEFRPERWENIPATVKEVPRVMPNLLTFFAGSTNCIGFRFSVIELKALLFILMRGFEFAPTVPKGGIGTAGVLQSPIVLDESDKGTSLTLFGVHLTFVTSLLRILIKATKIRELTRSNEVTKRNFMGNQHPHLFNSKSVTDVPMFTVSTPNLRDVEVSAFHTPYSRRTPVMRVQSCEPLAVSSCPTSPASSKRRARFNFLPTPLRKLVTKLAAKKSSLRRRRPYLNSPRSPKVLSPPRRATLGGIRTPARRPLTICDPGANLKTVVAVNGDKSAGAEDDSNEPAHGTADDSELFMLRVPPPTLSDPFSTPPQTPVRGALFTIENSPQSDSESPRRRRKQEMKILQAAQQECGENRRQLIHDQRNCSKPNAALYDKARYNSQYFSNPGGSHAKYSMRREFAAMRRSGSGRSRGTTLLRLRRGRLPTVGPRAPLGQILGSAGASESHSVKPQRSRSEARRVDVLAVEEPHDVDVEASQGIPHSPSRPDAPETPESFSNAAMTGKQRSGRTYVASKKSRENRGLETGDKERAENRGQLIQQPHHGLPNVKWQKSGRSQSRL
ncbi:hypothetical protein B0H16DRAFT_1448234 [Mycena metata]|uniref:Cytochrome P450 n=1 Tax=Mycena metata TaxID=1033252 RepID=A0AAD7KBP0_9AGAR|nr:hypothetical protein B0H16DRAFT_1448234 [Mycena metata]